MCIKWGQWQQWQWQPAVIIITRLPTDLRQDHPRLHAFSYTVASSHMTKTAVAPINPPQLQSVPCYTQTSWLCFTELELWPTEVLHCGIGTFDLFLLWPWSWVDNLPLWTWPLSLEVYRICKRELPTKGVWKLSSDRQTDNWQTTPKLLCFAGCQ